MFLFYCYFSVTNLNKNTVQDFKKLSFNSCNSENFLGVSDSSDPDVNFFNSVPKEQIKYFSIDNITVEMNFSEKNAFSILHLNIRSLNKKFKNLKTYLAQVR